MQTVPPRFARSLPAERAPRNPYSLRPVQVRYAVVELGLTLLAACALLALAGPDAGSPVVLALALALLGGALLTCSLRLRQGISVDRRGVTVRRGRKTAFHPWREVHAVVSEERLGQIHIGVRLHDRQTRLVRLGVLAGRPVPLASRLAACAPSDGVLIEHRGPWGTLQRERLVGASA